MVYKIFFKKVKFRSYIKIDKLIITLYIKGNTNYEINTEIQNLLEEVDIRFKDEIIRVYVSVWIQQEILKRILNDTMKGVKKWSLSCLQL